LFIRTALEALGRPVMLGLTATATPDTATEIALALGRAPEVVRTSVARPNLRYDVETAENAETRLRILVERLSRLRGGAAIVYARSRRSCESLARVLRSHGYPIDHYHAGLEPEERTRIQDAFVAGELQGVVATTAFGMGIDKPDVRLVCLVNYPDSLESYVQMVGRAGRDGEPSDTLLLAGPHDAASLRRFALSDVPTAEDLRRVYAVLRAGRGRADPGELAAGAPDRDPRVLVGILERAGLLTRGYDDGRLIVTELVETPPDAGARVGLLLERARAAAKARADRIVEFAENRRCRHAQVAEHFGERPPARCDACDVCAPPRAERSPRLPSRPLPDDVGAAIVETVRGLSWPLGRRGLIAMLRGSVSAPPSARRSPAFGILSAATEADVSRWVRALEGAGVLREVLTDDGFRVLTAAPGASAPRLGPAARRDLDTGLADRLRTWRRERASADGVPAFVILHDSTLTDLAASRPATLGELAGIRGVGPAKLERYGEELLAVVATAAK
jgi:ATP-dependent DNA helicase RecQ